MTYLFWICWSLESALMLWWLFDDLSLTYLPVNPSIFVGILYLAVVLFVRFGLGWVRVSNWMVIVPAIPLLGLLLIVVLATFSGVRWN